MKRIPESLRIQQINGLPNIEFIQWADEYKGNSSKAVIRCKIDNHVWTARIAHLLDSGSGCPECAGTRKLTPRECIEKINTVADGKFEFVCWPEGFKNSKSRVLCKCKTDGFEWKATVDSLVNRATGCPQCLKVRRWTADERIEQINSLPDIEFVRWEDEYKTSYSRAIVRCRIDGYEWTVTVNNIINNGNGCHLCSGSKVWTGDERISQINKLDNIEFVSWVSGYKSSKSKAVVRCKLDHFEWSATAEKLVNERTGCPHCAGNRRWTADERIEQINRIDRIEFIRWLDGYKDQHSKAVVRCEADGFEWAISVNNAVNHGRGCPKCARYGYNKGSVGFIYALLSECGSRIKIGISNKPKQRHVKLAKNTPFKFSLIEQASGDGAKIAELERYFHDKYESAGLSGFDGATEWLICTHELMQELRSSRDLLSNCV